MIAGTSLVSIPGPGTATFSNRLELVVHDCLTSKASPLILVSIVYLEQVSFQILRLTQKSAYKYSPALFLEF